MRGEEKRGKGEEPKRVTEKYAEIVSTHPTSLKKELYGGFPSQSQVAVLRGVKL